MSRLKGHQGVEDGIQYIYIKLQPNQIIKKSNEFQIFKMRTK